MRSWRFVMLMLAVVLATVACDESGEVVYPEAPPSSVGPTLANLQAGTTTLSRRNGGILRLSCEWASPRAVTTGTAYVAFVRSLSDVLASPTGVIGSGTASTTVTATSTTTATSTATASDTSTASGTATASETAAFFARFETPIAVPLGIGTDQKQGYFSVEIPFPTADIADAPLGRQQMLLWMVINGVKTNSLAFEVEFTP